MSCSSREGTPRLSAEHLVAIGLALASTALLLLSGCVTAPASSTPPASSTTADAPKAGVKPVVFEKEAAQASNELHTDRRLVEVPVDRARLGGKKVELWVTSDLGQNWTNHGESDASKASVGYLAPRDGRYGFRVVPVDAEGRRELTPKSGDAPERTVVVDSVPPVVEVLSPNGGEVLGAGRSTVVQWVAQDVNMAPAGVRIEATTGGADPWITVAKDLPNTGTYHWDIGLVSSARCRIRVVARDSAGNVAADESDREFTVDGLAPDLRLTGPAFANDLPAAIEWTGGDLGGAGLKRVSLYLTRDNGQTWQHAGDDEDLKSPFLLKELDGIYGVRLVAEDRMGNANPAPVAGMPPLMNLVLDRTKPDVKLLSPQAGGYLGGVAVDVRWLVRDNIDMPANGISLHFSADGGKSWKEIARGLKNDGQYTWTPPRTAEADCRFKIIAADFAGNVAEASSGRFGIDATVPEARATGPERSGSHSAQVLYEVRNQGSAPLKRVTLYYRPENVKEWIKYGDDPDVASPFLFAKADGKYAIYVTCATEQGLKSEAVQKAPETGTEPNFVLTIDATPPQLTLETFQGGGFVLAGAATDIVWRMVEPNPDTRGLSIFHSPDGGATWNVVVTDIDPTRGAYRWVVPGVGGARHKIRLVMADRFGNRGQVESEKPFTIDNDLPLVTTLERPPAISRSRRVAVKYKASDLTSGVERVLLYGKPVADKGPYKELSRSPQAEATMDTEVTSEGYWGFVLVAVDAAGHASVEPERLAKPDFVAGFDLTKPQIELKSSQLPQGTKTYLNAAWEVEWRASDTFSPADKLKVRLEFSLDGGKTWRVAIEKHPNTGKADLRAYLLPGKKHQVRAVVADEAGNEAEDVSTDFDPGDVPPAALVLRGIDEGRQYVAGSSIAVTWASPDRNIREASLERSKDGGRTWEFWAAMHTASMRVPLPDKEGRYHARVLARDAANRPVSSNFILFDVITGVEEVRLITYPSVEAGKLMRVLLEPKAVLRTARSVRLEISEDGQGWRKITDLKGNDETFLAPAAVGEYALRAVVTSPEGREYDSKHVKFKVVSATGAKDLELLNFRGGEVYPGGRGQVIQVRTNANPSELEVEFSKDSGTTWESVDRGNLTPVTGGLLWRPLPSVTSDRCRLRVKYREPGGKEIPASSAKDFAIDTTKPLARLMAAPEEVGGVVTIKPQVDVSISPVRKILLYVSEDGGKTWKLYDTYDVERGVTFAPSKPGEYGLYLVARSEAGLQQDPPGPGARPQATVKVQGRAPTPLPTGPLKLRTTLPETLKGGTTVDLRWACDDPSAKVTVSFVSEGKTVVLGKDQPPTGSLSWPVPRTDRKNCQIVLEAGDKSARSVLFEIDSSAPRIEGVEIEVPRK